ncbi:MAG: nicotinate-nucleotide adenylyltransferase [Bacteroidetes bacterium]|nr:nicotinate-nucleotide adenylyltransferase [Bacteroidota bacterium]
MRTGLFFGSFNPIHNGHLIIAQHMMNSGLFDEIRFVVSPQNPFKPASDLMAENVRFEMVKTAIADNPGFTVSDAELHLPKPSFTIHTLNHFKNNEPENVFSILMGSDQMERLHDWKDIEGICGICDFHVYQRRGHAISEPGVKGRFTFHDAPYLDISATYIRQLLKEKKSARYLIPDSILSYFSEP